MVPITLNNILEFIKNFVGWRENKKPIKFEVLSEQQYKDGLLLRVSRQSLTSRVNSAEVATYIWIPKNKNKPYLYLFLDSLDALGIRNLSHRIQILSSDRTTTDDSVKTNIFLSESYYLGTRNQAIAIVLKLILYCRDRNYEFFDWGWEIETCRKQVLGYNYTNYTQDKARENNRDGLDRFELRFSAPSKLSPIILECVSEMIEPSKKEPPKSRVVELLILGSILITLALILVKPSR